MRHFLFALVLLFPLTACGQQATTPGSVASSPANPNASVNSPIQPPQDATAPLPSMTPDCKRPTDLIGQSKDVLQTMKFSFTVRILGPDSAATMDFSPSRTNIIYDKQGIIRDITCG